MKIQFPDCEGFEVPVHAIVYEINVRLVSDAEDGAAASWVKAIAAGAMQVLENYTHSACEVSAAEMEFLQKFPIGRDELVLDEDLTVEWVVNDRRMNLYDWLTYLNSEVLKKWGAYLEGEIWIHEAGDYPRLIKIRKDYVHKLALVDVEQEEDLDAARRFRWDINLAANALTESLRKPKVAADFGRR